jgi:hypothetical protein
MAKLTKVQAAEAANQTAQLLYEALMLREAAAFIEEHHPEGDCEEAHQQIEVLRNVADEKSGEAFDVISYVDACFIEELKSKARKSKKLAVVKKAAA